MTEVELVLTVYRAPTAPQTYWCSWPAPEGEQWYTLYRIPGRRLWEWYSNDDPRIGSPLLGGWIAAVDHLAEFLAERDNL